MPDNRSYLDGMRRRTIERLAAGGVPRDPGSIDLGNLEDLTKGIDRSPNIPRRISLNPERIAWHPPAAARNAAPPPAPAPLPTGLGGPAPNWDPSQSAWTNFFVRGASTGDPTVDRIMDVPRSGINQVGQGLGQVAGAYMPRVGQEPETTPGRQIAGGIANIISGAGQTVAPVALPMAIAAAPIPTAIAMGTGTAGGWLAEKGAEKAGLAPEYQNLAGQVGGIIGGALPEAPAILGGLRAAGEAVPELFSGAAERARTVHNLINESLNYSGTSPERGSFSQIPVGTPPLDPELVHNMSVVAAHSIYNGAETVPEITGAITKALGESRVKQLGTSGMTELVNQAHDGAQQMLADFSQHIPPLPGEPLSPLAAMRQTAGPQGSLAELRRAAERVPGIGSPDNERMVFEDPQGQLAVGKITPDDWTQRVKANLSPAELTESRKWYRDLEGFFTKHWGENEGPKMMLAWLSSQQNASPSGGMTNVLRVIDQVRGLPKLDYKAAGLAENKIKGVLLGQIPAAGYGAKLTDFVDSGLGKTTRTWMGNDPRGGQPAVIDVWANRDVGKVDQRVYDYVRERFGDEAAQRLKVDGENIGATDYEYGSKFYNDLVNHLNQTGFDGGEWTGPETQAVGWVAMQKALGATPEFPSDIINKNMRRYGYEVAPGYKSPLAQQYPWETLPAENQRQITEYVGNRLTDLAARLTGAKIVNRNVQVGAYMGQPSPSISLEVVASPETFNDFARSIGYLGQQSEVWAMRPLKTGNATAFFLRTRNGSPLSTEQMGQLWGKVAEKVGADVVPGYSALDDGLMFVNPASKEYHAARADMGFEPSGAKAWTGAQKNKINDAIASAADEMGLDLRGHFDKIQLDAHGHNWESQGKPNVYLRRTTEAGRPALSQELSGPASQSVQNWWREAWERFGPHVNLTGSPTPGTAPAPTSPPQIIPGRAHGGLAPPDRGGLHELLGESPYVRGLGARTIRNLTRT